MENKMPFLGNIKCRNLWKIDYHLQLNASRGKERVIALKKGDIWVRPTTCMELKTMYNRNRQKKEIRQMILEYEEV